MISGSLISSCSSACAGCSRNNVVGQDACSDSPVVSLLDAAAACASLLHRMSLSSKAKSSHRHVNILCRFFPLDLHQQLVSGRESACQSLASWLELLIALMHDGRVKMVETGITYVAGVSCCHRNVYVGFCSGVRNTHGPCFGFSQRWYDHKVREVRAHVGTERRYKAWRTCTLPCKNHAMPVW